MNCSTCASGIDAEVLTPFWVPDEPGSSSRCAPQLCTEGLSLPNSPTVCFGRTSEVCEFECDDGYEASGVHRCTAESRFVGGQCRPKKCASSVENSPTQCSGVMGERCLFSCQCGFEQSGFHICGPSGSEMEFAGGACVQCPEGSASVGSECVACADGQEPTESGCDCVSCGPGSAGVAGVCLPCAAGTQPNSDRTTCIDCLAGFVSDGAGCKLCDATTFTLDNINCTIASDGSQPNADQSDEEPCPVGWAGVGGACSPCPAGSVRSPDRTSCEPCPRFHFSSDGRSCARCLTGSVPTATVGATACVSCSLEGDAEVEAPAYATTDWQACSAASVHCSPGEQPNALQTACVPCSNINDNLYSAAGVMCEACPPGQQPSHARDDCEPCAAGTYSSAGVCLPCADMGDTFYSLDGAARCTSCDVGTEPSVGRSSCVECADGFFSPYGKCQKCDVGTESNFEKSACVSCSIKGAGYFSEHGRCSLCPQHSMPVTDLSACAPCPANLLGTGGTCSSPCAVLSCANASMTGAGDITTVSLDNLCSGYPAWLDDDASKSLALSEGSGPAVPCTAEACSVDVAEGTTALGLSVGLGGRTTSCSLQVVVASARVSVSPIMVRMETLATANAESPILITNEGDEEVVLVELTFDATFVEVSGLRDSDGLQLELPAALGAKSTATAVIAGLGTSVPPGSYLANGTLVSSIGRESFSVSLDVKAVTLRLIALPSTLPIARLRAGEFGQDTFFSVYNVDSATAMAWSIDNCTTIDEATAIYERGGQPPPVTFSACSQTHLSDGSPSAVLPIGEQVSIRVLYWAPKQVVDSSELTVTIVGDVVPPTIWEVMTQMVVTPNDVLAGRSSASLLDPSVVAGQENSVVVAPRDMHGNSIVSFGLEFEAQALDSDGETDLLFVSSYDFDTQQYSIVFTLPKTGAFTLQVRLAGEAIGGGPLRLDVASVICDEVSSPNDEGSACICDDGFARLASGECGRCDAGSQPQLNAERGCESCTLYPGHISVAGITCVPCNTGRPSADRTSCAPCPAEQYFDALSNVCKACEAGERLNPDSEAAARPCVPCAVGAAGIGGACEQCDSGKQPNVDLTTCEKCPIGRAGTGGVCDVCPPGTAQKPDQTACTICPAGTYRNDEEWELCADCPQRLSGTHGMVSEPGSTEKSDCHCPRTYYDRRDIEGTDAPVVCYDEGITHRSVTATTSNKISALDFRSVRRRPALAPSPCLTAKCTRAGQMVPALPRLPRLRFRRIRRQSVHRAKLHQ